MPNQTDKGVEYVFIPDGAKVTVDSVDLGTFNSDITATLNFDINVINSSNRNIIKRVGRNQTMEFAGTLIDLDPAGVALVSAGMMTVDVISGAPIVPNDQVIAAGWTNLASNHIVATDPTSGNDQRLTVAPTLTSVTADSSGPLAAGDDYFIQPDVNSRSGYSIMFDSAGTATVATTEVVTIVFTTATPVASSQVSSGASTFEFEAYELEISHTDDAGLKRTLVLPRVTPNSGGFQFNFKSYQSDGSEEMPLSCVADLDTSLADGKQLFTWTIEEGAS